MADRAPHPERRVPVQENLHAGYFRAIFETHPIGAALMDATDRRVICANPALLDLMGRARADITGRTADELHLWPTGDPLDWPLGEQARATRLATPGGHVRDVLVTRRDVTIDARPCMLLLVRDLMDVHREAARSLHAASHQQLLVHRDVLTGLLNRTAVMQRLEAYLATSTAPALGVLLVNFMGFPQVDATLGFLAGDAAVLAVAARLEQLTSAVPGTILGRIDGTLFVVARSAPDVADLEAYAQALLQNLDVPFDVQGHELHLSPRVGLSVSPRDGLDADTLFSRASVALASACRRAGVNAEVYRQGLADAARERLRLEEDLRRAVRDPSAFQVHYQPIVDAAQGVVASAEALVRWAHPTRGLLSPGAFMGIAESSGMVVEIGRRVLRVACAQTAQWGRAGLEMHVNVNVAAAQFERGDLVPMVAQALSDAGLPPSRLTLELSERVLLEDEHNAAVQLARLRVLGVRVAVDDFGTGYSNLAGLVRLPVDDLKLDRSFMRDLTPGGGALAVVESTLLLTRRLDLKVVVEGVETVPQLEQVRQLGCELIQGFYFAAPMTAEAFLRFAYGFNTQPAR